MSEECIQTFPRSHEVHNAGQQLWARYLEGDKIPTKIGTRRVEIEIGEHFYLDHRGEIEIGVTWKKIRSDRGSQDCNKD